MTESRLQRWSRKKNEAGKKPDSPPPPIVESEPSLEEQELATNEALPEHELLAKYDLPNPDAIELGTDITGFMRKEIPEFLRRRALRSLWRSNPVLAVLDGLNDYDEDFTSAATGTSAVKTLYKVGQGMFDKEARKAEKQAEKKQEAPEENPVAVQIEEPESRVAQESLPTNAQVDAAVLPTGKGAGEEIISAEAEKPASHYRPRMRFDY
jgi:hypothetical protein